MKSFRSPASSWLMFGIDLAVSAFEVGVAHDGRAAVPGAGDVDHVEVVFLDDPVQVRVNEVLPGRRAPVPQQHVLHVRERQRPLQQRIVVEINLADRQIVGGAPVGVHPVEQFRVKVLVVFMVQFSFFVSQGRERGRPSWRSCVLRPCE